MSLQASSRLLRVPLPAGFLFGLVIWQALIVQAVPAQVVRIAPKANACDPALVDAGMEVSGLKDFGKLMSAEINPMFAQMERGLRAQGKRLLPEDRNRIFEIMQQAFATEAVNEEVLRSMRSHCEPKAFAAAVEQLRTPLATKVRGFEDQFDRSHSPSAVNRYAASLQQHPPAETREALIDAMEKTVHQADFTADTDAHVIVALYMGLSGKATDDNQLSALREQILPAARKSTRIELLMIYRNLTDEELDQYIMLLRTPELQRFQTIYKSAVQNAIVRRSEVLAAMVRQHIDSRAARH